MSCFFFSVVWFLSEFFVLGMGLGNRHACWGAVDILNFSRYHTISMDIANEFKISLDRCAIFGHTLSISRQPSWRSPRKTLTLPFFM